MSARASRSVCMDGDGMNEYCQFSFLAHTAKLEKRRNDRVKTQNT